MRRRAILTITASAAMLVGSFSPPAAAQAARQDDASYIVVLAEGADVPRLAQRLARENAGEVEQLFENVVGGFQFTGPSAAAAGLARSPHVTAVVPDEQFSLIDVAGMGFFRIGADQSVSDPAGPYRGAYTRIAIIDSGIDTDHPDFAANLDLANSRNCQAPGSLPEDDNGHGTHVAGIAAATFGPNGYGVVGVAPNASIVALKAFDASGYADTSDIVCALDHLAALTTSSPVPTAINMSFAEAGTDDSCGVGAIDVLHEAICGVVEAGQLATPSVPVVAVAAAGNSDVDAGGTVPAAYHDVITVSALADHDGKRGGLAGCVYIQLLFNSECDDTLASFSNFGATVDVAAPGVDIYSTVPGGHGYNSGTSMAAPHVTGVVALVLGEHAAIDVVGVRSLLLETGECPDGSAAGTDGSCSGQGAWRKTKNRSLFEPVATDVDPDGVAEPLVNAARAAARADELGEPAPPPPPPASDDLPQATITSHTTDQQVSGVVTISGSATDDEGVKQVDVLVGGTPLDPVSVAGGQWSVEWDTTAFADGPHSITAKATDLGDQTATATVTVQVANEVPTDATMRVGSLEGSARVKGKSWTATVHVGVVDAADGVGIGGVTVNLTFASPATASLAAKGGTPGRGGGGGGGSDPGTGSGAVSCVTDVDGRCSVSTNPAGDSVRFTVTGLAKDGWVYDPTLDTDQDNGTDGTNIVISKASA